MPFVTEWLDSEDKCPDCGSTDTKCRKWDPINKKKN